MIDSTIGGQLSWNIDPQSFATDIKATPIERDLLATRTEWTPKEKEIIQALSILLSCTQSVEIVGTKKPAAAVLKMVEFINTHPSPGELVEWRFKLPYQLKNAWEQAWAEGQQMFEVDPVQLPTDNLTDEQKADPFLVKSA
jgi:hypothetical protein